MGRCVLGTNEFQSSPGPKAGRSEKNAPWLRDSIDAFQSSPGPKAGRSEACPRGSSRLSSMFQSSPGPKAGRSHCHVMCSVSEYRFQSSPGPKAGRSMGVVVARQGLEYAFQSSPGPKAGRSPTDRDLVRLAHPRVSILARPEGRALRHQRVHALRSPHDVSILARPEGRALPARDPHRAHVIVIVSILARPEGRALPARDPHRAHVIVIVSILARPEGRALLGPFLFEVEQFPFQSSPGPKAGRSRRGTGGLGGSSRRRFNPRPARRPGAPPLHCWRGRTSRSFNPRPARRPGAPHRGHHASGPYCVVSILARPEGRALPGRPCPRR